MAYVHSKGIAHLDLKTTNILLTADKRSTLVADFGISQTQAGFGTGSFNPVFAAEAGAVEMTPMGQHGSGGGAAAGGHPPLGGNVVRLALTPQYTAPERLFRHDLSFVDLLATDVYTFGARAWSNV